MASNHILLVVATVVVLSSVAGAAAAAAVDDGAAEQCRQGEAIPHNPLSGCRGYVISRACPGRGPRLPALAKARCCCELAAVPASCRCEALRLFVEGGHLAGLLGCTREEQWAVAATLMEVSECDVRTDSGSAAERCHWLAVDGDVPKHWS